MIAPWRNEKIRMAYKRPEIQASVEIILSVFAVVGLLVLAIRPTLATVATLQKKIEDQTIVDGKLSTKIAQLVKANADLGTYANRISDYSLAVTDTPDNAGPAKRIAAIARENNITVNSLAMSAVPLVGQQINLSDKKQGLNKPPMEKDGKVANYVVSFDVFGTPNLVYDFLTKLENMDRLMLITEITMKKEEIKLAGTATVVDNLRVIGKAETYYVLIPTSK